MKPMHRLTGLALALALLSAPALPAAAAPKSQTVTVERGRLAGLPEFIDGVMAQQLATREVAGAVVTIVHKGKVVLTRGYGFADVAAGKPVDGQTTLFRPGSVSKLITWVALMQQVERGKVDLDADVNRYIDYTIPPYEGAPVKVRDLLSHSPGMSDVGDLTVDEVGKLRPYSDWLKTHIPTRQWAPGTEVSYSNYGAALAGYIVERVSGEPFADYVDRHIFAPLGMRHSFFREPLPAAVQPNMATGYKVKDGRLVAEPFELFSNVMPAGSGSATAPDMARFMLAMLGDGKLGAARILTPQSVALLESNSLANAPNLPGMAHGFMVARERAPRMVGHGGNTGDFHSYLLLVPEADLGFFVSTTGGPGSYGARTELSDAIIGRLFPQTPAPRWTGAADAPRAGAYRMNRRDYTKPARPEYDVQVSAAGPHALTLVNQGKSSAWEQIGPGLYEQVTGARAGGPYDRLEFYGTPENPRLSFASMPHVTYHLVKP